MDAIQKTTGVEVKQTKQGYAKDGFIVDDEEEEDDEYSDDDDDDESSEITPPKKLSVKGRKPASKEKAPVVVQPTENDDLQVEDCESELSEESYV